MTTSNHWQAIAEEAILDYFRTHDAEPFHSDDLEHVIPDEHRGVISLAVMALVNKKLIVGCGYRKSAIPSRKRSPSQEYRLTELGRDRVARIGTGVLTPQGSGGLAARQCASTDPGDTPKEVDSGSEVFTSSLPAGVDAGSQRGRDLQVRGAGSTRAAADATLRAETSQPARLFELSPAPPSAYDPYSEAA